MFDENHYFRFRNIKSLLDGYHELERQQIFFADILDQNDPQEGLINFYWNGDKVAWKALLKHFLLSLDQYVFLSYLLDNEFILDVDSKLRFSPQDLPSEEYKSIIHEIEELFFGNKSVISLLNILCKTNRNFCLFTTNSYYCIRLHFASS